MLLGFAFVFAYLIPFLVASESSSVTLLVLYTTIVTFAIATINYLYLKHDGSEHIEYLQGIGVLGMTSLLSIASFGAHSQEVISIFM